MWKDEYPIQKRRVKNDHSFVDTAAEDVVVVDSVAAASRMGPC